MSLVADHVRQQLSETRHARRVGLSLLLLAVFSVVGSSAWAYWTTLGSGLASASTGTLNVPTNVTVPGTSTGTVLVSWTGSTLSNSTPAQGYYVTRIKNSDSSTASACGSSPTTLVTSACTDSSVPDGTYYYTVTAVYNTWTATSNSSNSVLVDTLAPVVVLNAPTTPTKVNKPPLSGSAGKQVADATHSADTLIATVSITGGPTTGAGGTAAVSSVTGVWSYTPTVSLADGTYTISVTQTDAAGNTATAATGTVLVDTVAPVVVLNAPTTPTKVNKPPLSGTAGKQVADATHSADTLIATVSITGGPTTGAGGTAAVSSVTGVWSYTPTVSLADGTYTISVTQTDAAGNTATAATGTVLVDTAAPSVTLTAPTNGSSTNVAATPLGGAAGNAAGDSTTVTVKIYSGTGTLLQTLTPTRSTNTWSATAATLAQGTYTAQATQTDTAGNLGTTTANTFTIDTTVPTVTGVSSTLANGGYKVGTSVPLKVTFSENVTVTGTPTLTLSTGTPTTTPVNYSSGSGTSTLTFNYTVAAGNNSGDLDYATTSALAAGTIRDTAGNDATRTLAAPGATNSLGANKDLLIDGIAPSLVSATSSGGSTPGLMQLGDTLVLTFNEALAPASVPTVVTVTEARNGGSTLTIPGLLTSASISNIYLGGNNASGSATSTSVVLSNGNKTVTITLGAVTTTGNGLGTGPSQAVSLNPDGALTDVVGNGAVTGSTATINRLF